MICAANFHKTKAEQPLLDKEMEVLRDIKIKMNKRSGYSEKEPAQNIFILVNFWNRLVEEQDEENRNDVKQRMENSLLTRDQNDCQIIANSNKIHYIAAKQVLDAKLNKAQNNEYLSEHLNTFHNFTTALSKFLTVERGYIKIQQFATRTSELVNEILSNLKGSLTQLEGALTQLDSSEETLHEEIRSSESQLKKLLEDLGEASTREVRIREQGVRIKTNAVSQAKKSFDSWSQEEGWRGEIKQKIKFWSSENSALFVEEEAKSKC